MIIAATVFLLWFALGGYFWYRAGEDRVVPATALNKFIVFIYWIGSGIVSAVLAAVLSELFGWRLPITMGVIFICLWFLFANTRLGDRLQKWPLDLAVDGSASPRQRVGIDNSSENTLDTGVTDDDKTQTEHLLEIISGTLFDIYSNFDGTLTIIALLLLVNTIGIWLAIAMIFWLD
jgi:hypothetical protein